MIHADAFRTPAFCVALALSVGLVAQTLARHLRVPGIIVLLHRHEPASVPRRRAGRHLREHLID